VTLVEKTFVSLSGEFSPLELENKSAQRISDSVYCTFK